MAHAIVAVNCDPEQHKRIVKSINSRLYSLTKSRVGGCRGHVSEIRILNIRAKKEILPFILRDLKVGNLYPNKKVTLKQVLKGEQKIVDKDKEFKNKAFFSGRFNLLSTYIIQRILPLVRLRPVTVASGKPVPFVDGWHYAHAIGWIDDVERVPGIEEL